ncbi:MAG: CheR family methyltransferase [Bacteroidota bacterium]
MIKNPNTHIEKETQHKIPLSQETEKERLISGMTEMFRDPSYFQLIRKRVIPYLETFPHVHIWHAGCSTGEEAFSMGILLEQADLIDKTQILATDKYEHRLIQARNGRFESKKYQAYSGNYLSSGLQKDFDSYFSTHSGYMQIKNPFLDVVEFCQHDLLLEEQTNAFACIFCRNVLIYYSEEEKVHILQKLLDCLIPTGFLILGHVEDIRFLPSTKHLKTLEKGYSIYQKNCM